jgi:hypothetical protein
MEEKAPEIKIISKKDPIRHKVQGDIESEFKSNFSKSMKLMQVQIARVLTKGI